MHFSWFQLIKSLCAEHCKPLCTLNTLLSREPLTGTVSVERFATRPARRAAFAAGAATCKKSNCRNKSGTFKSNTTYLSMYQKIYDKLCQTSDYWHFDSKESLAKEMKESFKMEMEKFQSYAIVRKPSNTCTQVLCCSPLVLAGNLASTWPCWLVKSSFELWALVQLLCLFVWTRQDITKLMQRLHAVVSDLFLKHMHQPLTGAAAANGIEAIRSNAIVETLACRCSLPNSPTTMKLHMQTTTFCVAGAVFGEVGGWL